MRRRISNHFFILTVFFAISGCVESPKEKIHQNRHDLAVSSEKIDFAKEELRTEIDNYRFAAMDKLLTNEFEIMKYKETIVHEKVAVRRVYEDRIRVLEDNNLKLKSRISTYESLDKSSWVDFKSELDRDIQLLADDIILLVKN